MRHILLTFMVVLFVGLASFAQDADSTGNTFKIRKPADTYGIDSSAYVIDTFSTLSTSPGVIPVLTTRRYKVDPQPLILSRPPEAKIRNISGIVYVSYEWNAEERKTANVKLEKSVDPQLDEIALNYVRGLTLNHIGEDVGTFSNGRYTIPIHFPMD